MTLPPLENDVLVAGDINLVVKGDTLDRYVLGDHMCTYKREGDSNIWKSVVRNAERTNCVVSVLNLYYTETVEDVDYYYFVEYTNLIQGSQVQEVVHYYKAKGAYCLAEEEDEDTYSEQRIYRTLYS